MSELGPEARSVVEAGRAGDDPTPRDRARVRAALMTAIAAGGAGTAAVVGEGAAAASVAKGTAVAGAIASGWGWKAIFLGLALTGGVATGVAVTAIEGPAAPTQAGGSGPAVAPTPPARPVLAAPPPPVAPPATTPEPPPASPPGSPPVGTAHALAPAAASPASPARPADPEPAASATPAAPSPTPIDPLEAETRGLGEAHSALQDGDPARALALLDAQSAAYAGGQLREERAAARILALCKLGRTGEARALAARFLAESPRSLLADRVRSACPAGDPR